MSEPNTKGNDVYKKLLFGGISGILSRTVTAPLELTKIRNQNTHVVNQSMKNMIKNEGLCSLWKGNGVNCLRIFPQNAINFTIHDKTKSHVLNIFPNLSNTYSSIIGGTISGAISMIAIYPLENARTRLSIQTNGQIYKNIFDIFKKVPLTQLYQGLQTSIIGYAPYNALLFGFNSYLNGLIHDKTSTTSFLIGGLSGCFAVSITYPTDLIRRRQQILGDLHHSKNFTQRTFMGITREIIKVQGIKGLYKGLIPCYMKIFPSMAITFLTYNKLSEIF